MADDLSLSLDGNRQEFQQQIDFFRAKLNLPTKRWDDIKTAAHDRAFMVAGAQKADLLNDLRLAVDKSVSGQSIGEFRKDFAAAVAKSGWSGWTGQGTKAGEAWRTRVIYQTNIATSYAAGRWQQLNDPDLKAARPFWRYIHADGVVHPRPLHKAWGDSGLTLPNDHPFWLTHFPPNGWGCGCRVKAVRLPRGTDATSPPDGWDGIDAKTGAPAGVDKGWGYAPGANSNKSFQSLIDNKLLNLDAPIGASMAEALKPELIKERLAAWQRLFDATRQTMLSRGDTVLVHAVTPNTVKALSENGVSLENAAIWMRDRELLHALRDYKTDRGAALPDEIWRDLPLRLDDAVPYLDINDVTDKQLVYSIDLGDQLGKIALKVNINKSGRFDGVRATVKSNFVQTGGLVQIRNMGTGSQYLRLKK